MKTVLRAGRRPVRPAQAGPSAPLIALEFAERVGFPLVGQAACRGRAKSTFRLDDPADLLAWLDNVPPTPDRPAQIGSSSPATEGSYDSVMVDGQVVLDSVSNYLPTPARGAAQPVECSGWLLLADATLAGRVPPQAGRSRPQALKGPRAHYRLTTPDPWMGFLVPDTGRRLGGRCQRSARARPAPRSPRCSATRHDFDLYTAWAALMVGGGLRTARAEVGRGHGFYLRGQGAGQVRAVQAPGRAARPRSAPGRRPRGFCPGPASRLSGLLRGATATSRSGTRTPRSSPPG